MEAHKDWQYRQPEGTVYGPDDAVEQESPTPLQEAGPSDAAWEGWKAASEPATRTAVTEPMDSAGFGKVVFKDVRRASDPETPASVIRVAVAAEPGQTGTPISVRLKPSISKGSRRLNSVRPPRVERPVAPPSTPAIRSEVITASNPRDFFRQTTAWHESDIEASPKPEAASEPLTAPEPEEGALNKALLGDTLNDTLLEQRRAARAAAERRGGEYRIKAGVRIVKMAGEDTTDAQEEADWKNYMDTPLPEDEPLLHERLAAWYERTRESLPGKIDNVAQYLKSLGRMEKPRMGSTTQLQERARNIARGCGALLDTFKDFSYGASTAVFNIKNAGVDKLRELNNKLEPEQRRRAILGLAIGVVAVGATSYAMRRGFTITDMIGGQEDQIAARPRSLPDTDKFVDASSENHRTGLTPQDALEQKPTEMATVPADKAPTTAYTYPWDWAAERFGDDNATPQLHRLAEQAAADGHDIVWHNAGTATEWVEVNGSSRTKDILDVLSGYAA